MSRLINLTGQRFGRLTVIERAENKVTSYGQTKTMWKCQCDCGNTVSVLASNLVSGITKSCGCFKKKYISNCNTVDLTGQRFGKLTVLKKSDRMGKNSYWLCRCDCGNEKEINATALRNGQKSCGCSAYDFAKDKIIGNKYTIDKNNVVHVLLRAGEVVLCDIKDWEKLKQYTWRVNKYGYATAPINRKQKRFHVEILGKRDGYVVDHIDQNKLNNQRNNLRFVTKSGNAANSKLSKNNTSGIKGVYRDNKRGKWCARIMVNGKNLHLGYYNDVKDAAEARRKGEEKYFKPLLEINKFNS